MARTSSTVRWRTSLLGKELSESLVLVDGGLEMMEHLGAHPPALEVVSNRLGEKSGETLMGLLGKRPEFLPHGGVDLGTELDVGHEMEST